eukprot:5187555-Amphidinium_carterae.2
MRTEQSDATARQSIRDSGQWRGTQPQSSSGATPLAQRQCNDLDRVNNMQAMVQICSGQTQRQSCTFQCNLAQFAALPNLCNVRG